MTMNNYSSLEKVLEEAERTRFRFSSWQTEKVSIIIPTYNRIEYLYKIILALTKQTYNLNNIEIVIADDGSSDGSKEMVEAMELPFQVKYVWQQNKGYRVSKNRNNGLKVASHENIILLDCDMLPAPELVETYMKWHYIAEQLGTDVMLIGRRQFVKPEDVNDEVILEKRLSEIPPALHATTGSSVDWREEKYSKSNNLKDLSRWSNPEWVLSSAVCSGNISFKKSRAFAADLFDEDFQDWGAEDKLFGDWFFYSQKMFPDKPIYFIPVNASAFHLEHPVCMRTRSQEIERTKRLYYKKLSELKQKPFFPSPAVSVYMPAWNSAKFIEQAIKSVYNQTFKDVEVCVVEDRGDDNTWEILEQLVKKYNIPGQRPFLRISRNEQNKGIGATSNCAVQMCHGKYILQLDSDDWLANNAVESLVDILNNNPDVGLVYGDTIDVDTFGKKINNHWSTKNFTKEDIAMSGYKASLDKLFETGMCIHPPRMFRRNAFYKTEGFAEDISSAIDYDIFMKLSEVTKVLHIKKELYFYRKNNGSVSLREPDKQQENAKIVQKRGKQRRNMAQAVCFKYFEVEPNLGEIIPNNYISDNRWKVSVYMPLSLGNLRYLEESIDSILSQTINGLGICIGVDDTTENAEAFLALMNNKYKHLFDPTSNQYGRIKYAFTNISGGSGGAAAASNVAVNIALDVNKSKYILHLDPDDCYCHNAAVERLVQFMENNPDCVLAYADYNDIDNDGKQIGTKIDKGFSRSKLWSRKQPFNQVGHPRIYDADVLCELRNQSSGKLFDEQLLVCIDLDTILRADILAQKNGREIKHYDGNNSGLVERLLGTSTVLANYRNHNNSISSQHSAEQYEMYRTLVEKYKPLSACC